MGPNSRSAASILNLSVTSEWHHQKKINYAGMKIYTFKSQFPNESKENIQLPSGGCITTLKIRSQSMNKYISTLPVWFLKYVVS